MSTSPSWYRAIGPGVLYAGAAIGVSHLVQSTRAGAAFGLTLAVAVVLAHVFKYPAMRVGSHYAAATGDSLVAGYRRRGWWALGLFTLVTVGTMFIIVAAITLITASLVRVALAGIGVEVAEWIASLSLLGVCIALLAIGGYRGLDRALKVLMVLMLGFTLFAAGSQAPTLWIHRDRILPAFDFNDAASIALLAALVGWMPAPLDISAWQSMWTLERNRVIGERSSCKACRLDFHIGYALCVITALSFLALGAAVMNVKGVEPSSLAVGFTVQLTELYTDSMGEWVRPIILLGALAVMFSTTITVLDAIPRVLDEIGMVALDLKERSGPRVGYWVSLVSLAGGAFAIVHFRGRLGDSWTTLIDLATTLAFLSTPLLAWLNHLAWTGREVPEEHRPGVRMRVFSWFCIAVWVAFAVLWIDRAWPWATRGGA